MINLQLCIIERVTLKPVWSDDERSIEGWDETGSEISVVPEDAMGDVEEGDATSEGTQRTRVIATVDSHDVGEIIKALESWCADNAPSYDDEHDDTPYVQEEPPEFYLDQGEPDDGW